MGFLMKKWYSLLFIVMLFLIVFSIAEEKNLDEKLDGLSEEEVRVIDDLLEDYLSIGNDPVMGSGINEKINDLNEVQKSKFFEGVGEKLGIESFKKLDIKKFDSNGNVLLNGGGLIPIFDILGYQKKIDEARVKEGSGDLDKTKDFPKLKEIEITDDGKKYIFENKASIELKGGADFDFKTREVLGIAQDGKKRKGVIWANMNGEIIVLGNEISSKVILDENGEVSGKDIAVFETTGKDKESITSFFKGGVTTLPRNFKNPEKGKYKVYEKRGETFMVDSNGNTFYLMESSFSFDDNGEIKEVKNSLLNMGDGVGKFFVEQAIISRGETEPNNKKENYIWVKRGEKEGELASVSVNYVKGEKMHYFLNGNLESLRLNGDVLAKNGDVNLESNHDGLVRLRKTLGTKGEMEFELHRLYGRETPDDYFVLKKYEGENEQFKGRITFHDKEGNLLSASLSIGEMGNRAVSYLEFELIQGRQVITGGPPDSDVPGYYSGTPIGFHEATHGINNDVNGGGLITLGRNEGGDFKQVFVSKSEVTQAQVGQNVPDELLVPSYSRFEGYYVDQPEKGVFNYGPRDSLSTLDEFSAYHAGFTRDFETPDKSYGSTKYGNTEGIYEFGMFATSALVTIKKNDPEGWADPKKYANYRGAVKGLLERSMTGIDKVYSENKYSKLRSRDIPALMNRWGTSRNEKTVALREILIESYGRDWTFKYMGF